MQVEIVEGNAITSNVDVLCLKFAQRRYGLDSQVHDLLLKAGVDESRMSPEPGTYALVPAAQPLGAREVLFCGTNNLGELGYPEMRALSRGFLAALRRARPMTRTLALTVHGAGYGLDAAEAFESMIAGLMDAVREGEAPTHLECITFVEFNRARTNQLQRILKELLPSGTLSLTSSPDAAPSHERLRAAGYASASKSHVFVAMPFADEFQDVYDYAIQGAVNRCGYLCERVDFTSFTGDVMTRVQERIRTASFLVADLTGANPNVYLEVGYAWGCGVPCVLLVNESNDLKFDVRGQRCIVYKRIKELEEKLAHELAALLESTASNSRLPRTA